MGLSLTGVVMVGILILVFALLLPIINIAIGLALPSADEPTAIAIQLLPFIVVIAIILSLFTRPEFQANHE